MSVSAGARLGPYEVLGPLGSGGMGEVFLARDTRLDRTVAIKVLAAEGSGSPERRQRLEREARAISRLSHPHICALYDVGEQDDSFFLVMEHLQGPTLAERLKEGALPLANALRWGAEIAEALAVAHRAGIVHRDLKPANVILTREGAKVLDFGLARLREEGGGGRDHTDSLTLTRQGAIVGTVPYMSPEQVEGRPADTRADIWAFGTVLYEMVTGRRAFQGESRASVIAAILTSQLTPSRQAQPSAPSVLDWLIKRCLAKDPEERWQSADDIAAHLRFMLEGGSHAAEVPVAGRHRPGWARAVAIVVAALAGLVAGVLLRTEDREPARGAVRLSIVPPADAPYHRMREPAVSPDGRQIAFVGEGGDTLLYARPLDAVAARPVAGTAGASMPFWSPDGRWLAFFAEGKLKRVSLASGHPEVLCEASYPQGGTWGKQDVILFAPRGIGAPLFRVPASGGTPVPATVLGPREVGHLFPDFLPDGQHFVFLADAAVPRDHALRLGRLDTTETTVLTEAVSNVLYAPPGHLLFERDGALMAQAFDTRALQLRGEPAAIADSPVEGIFNVHRYEFSLSSNGVLAYRAAGMDKQLAWFDRSGRPLGEVGPRRSLNGARLSPDQTRVAFTTKGADWRDQDLWSLDLVRGTLARLTSNPEGESQAVWSPDGRRIAFLSTQTGFGDLYVKPADEMGGERPLVLGGSIKFPTSWSSDGRYFLFDQDHGGRSDIFVLDMAGQGAPRPFVETPFDEWHATLSPDGRWVAYASDESGQGEVYVRAFADPQRKWQISVGGAEQPRWRGDGRELLYRTASGRIVAVPIAPGDIFRSGPPQALFSPAGEYDVAADGQRFLVAVPTVDPRTAPITVVLDWPQALPR
jgi:Tol biopolymer transport system component